MEVVTVEKYNGRFDVFNRQENQIKYFFRGIPLEVCSNPSFLFEDEGRFDLDISDINEDYTPLDFAIDLLAIAHKKFLYWSQQKDLQKVIDYLAENKEEQCKLLVKKMHDDAVSTREKLSRQIEYLNRLIKTYSEMMEE